MKRKIHAPRLKKQQVLIGLGILASVIAIGLSGYTLVVRRQAMTASSKTPVETSAITKKSEGTPSIIDKIPTESVSTNESPTPPSVSTGRVPTNTTASASPPTSASIPLLVSTLSSTGARTYCESSQIRMDIVLASVFFNGGSPGILNWQVEETASGIVTVGKAGTVSIAAQQLNYDIPLNGYFFIASASDSAIRIHVTSPNDKTTPWYTPQYSGGNCGM